MKTGPKSNEMIQPLEPRMLLSIAPAVAQSPISVSVSGTLPASIIAGQKTTLREIVSLTSSQAVKGAITLGTSLSTSAVFDSTNAIALPVTLKKNINLQPGKTVKFPITIKTTPDTAPAGTYHVQAEVTQADGSISGGTSSPTVAVTAPVVDLTGTFVNVPSTIKVNHRVVITFAVVNNGNIPAVGKPKFQIGASADGKIDANTVIIGAFLHSINLKPGKPMTIHFASKPTAAGSFFLVGQVNGTDLFNETHIQDNTFLSPTKVTIV